MKSERCQNESIGSTNVSRRCKEQNVELRQTNGWRSVAIFTNENCHHTETFKVREVNICSIIQD